MSRSSASGASNEMPIRCRRRVSRAAPEPGTEPAPQPDQRVAVVERPLDAQADEDEEDDREPELVTGGRAGLGGGRARVGGCARAARDPEGLDGGSRTRGDGQFVDVEERDGEAGRGIRVDRRGGGADGAPEPEASRRTAEGRGLADEPDGAPGRGPG